MTQSKYKNIKTDGYSSKKEANRAAELRLLERAGHISGLREQVAYMLAPSVIIQGRKRPEMKYVADFVYFDRFKTSGDPVVEDCKGFRTPVYKLKRHLMKSLYNIDILET
jgi:hypothetical protein